MILFLFDKSIIVACAWFAKRAATRFADPEI